MELSELLGGKCDPLQKWYSAGVSFLKKELVEPAAKPNDFRWIGFSMSAPENDAAVVEATYQFGMECMGYVEGECVPF